MQTDFQIQLATVCKDEIYYIEKVFVTDQVYLVFICMLLYCDVLIDFRN